MQLNTQKIKVNSDGTWNTTINSGEQAGIKTVVVQSVETGQKDVGFFNVIGKPLSRVVDSVNVNYLFNFGMLSMFLLLMFMVWYSIRLGIKMKTCNRNLEMQKLNKNKKFANHSIIVSMVVVVLAFIIVYGPNNLKELASGLNLNKKIESVKEVIIHSVSGAVISPIENKPISGVDLVNGDVSQKTGEAGRYQFSDINSNSYITLTHPNLRRQIKIKPTQNLTSIYFDEKLYNTLINFIEISVKKDDLSPYLLGNVKSEYVFDSTDLLDQELILEEVSLEEKRFSKINNTEYRKVVKIILNDDGLLNNFHFYYDNESWKIVD